MNLLKKLVRSVIYGYRIFTLCVFVPCLLVLLGIIFCVEIVAWCAWSVRYQIDRLYHWAFASPSTCEKPDLAWIFTGLLTEMSSRSFLQEVVIRYIWTGKTKSDTP